MPGGPRGRKPSGGADIDERRLEVGHHPLSRPRNTPVDPGDGRSRRAICSSTRRPPRQRHQEAWGQHVDDPPVGAAHDAAAFQRRVSNSGNPTTLL